MAPARSVRNPQRLFTFLQFLSGIRETTSYYHAELDIVAFYAQGDLFDAMTASRAVIHEIHE